MKSSNYLKVIKYSALYDIIITFPFALPVVAALHIALLRGLHETFSFSGTIADFTPTHLFFVNLMGSVVVVWSALRIYKPKVIYGLFDFYARALFSSWMCFYLFFYDLSSIIWLLLIPEISWGVIQLVGYVKLNRLNVKNRPKAVTAEELMRN